MFEFYDEDSGALVDFSEKDFESNTVEVIIGKQFSSAEDDNQFKLEFNLKSNAEKVAAGSLLIMFVQFMINLIAADSFSKMNSYATTLQILVYCCSLLDLKFTVST